jgi:hypothetical protein
LVLCLGWFSICFFVLFVFFCWSQFTFWSHHREDRFFCRIFTDLRRNIRTTQFSLLCPRIAGPKQCKTTKASITIIRYSLGVLASLSGRCRTIDTCVSPPRDLTTFPCHVDFLIIPQLDQLMSSLNFYVLYSLWTGTCHDAVLLVLVVFWFVWFVSLSFGVLCAFGVFVCSFVLGWLHCDSTQDYVTVSTSSLFSHSTADGLRMP